MRIDRSRRTAVVAILLTSTFAARLLPERQEEAGGRKFRFAIIGDRTGEAVPGVYEKVWQETDADHPDFVINVGDTIQGMGSGTVDEQWQEIERILSPYKRYEIFSTPGNHDVWSFASALEFSKYTRHPLHYGFDYKQAHFTVLNNSRNDNLAAAEYTFLQQDLTANQDKPVKFIFLHRPSWLLYAVLRNPKFALHQLAKRYGVQYVMAGHVHQMLHLELQGVTYLCMPSSGGHLRGGKEYSKGWFFGHTIVTVNGRSVQFEIKEAGAPYGESRISKPADWGAAGLVPAEETSK